MARRPQRPRPRARPGVASSSGGLTRDRIVRAAIQEIDERGLAAFSIRSLAGRLGVYPTAIYWHIASRELILAEIVGDTLSGTAPAAELAWQPYLRELFTRYRRAIKKHPAIAPLVGAHLVGNSSIPLAFVERLLGKLDEAGFAGDDLVAAYNCVVAALVGFITQEYAPVPDAGQLAWQSRVKDRLDNVDPQAYPLLANNLSALANKAFILRWQSGVDAPLDASFERYVEMILGGLQQLAARSHRRPGRA
jgi:TetR/AcrR family tetracycline transcriptional repressor